MAFALVQEVGKRAQAASGGNNVISVTSAPAANHLLILRAMGASQAISGVTDSKGNTWTLDKQATTTGRPALASTVQDVGTLTTSDTVTVTYAANTTTRIGIIDEFSGTAATSRVDQTATTTASTTNRDAGTTGTTSQANELVVGCFAVGSAESSFTHGSGYSDFTTTFSSNLEGEYKVVSATGTQNPTATGGTSANSSGVVVTYKEQAVVTGAASLPIILAYVVAGVRKALGIVVRAQVVTFTVAGVRKTFGVVARPQVFTTTVAGVRKTFGVAARAQTFTIHAAGVRKTFGVATRPQVFTITAAGVRKALGVAALPMVLSFTADGTVTGGGGTTFEPGTVGFISAVSRGALAKASAGELAGSSLGGVS